MDDPLTTRKYRGATTANGSLNEIFALQITNSGPGSGVSSRLRPRRRRSWPGPGRAVACPRVTTNRALRQSHSTPSSNSTRFVHLSYSTTSAPAERACFCVERKCTVIRCSSSSSGVYFEHLTFLSIDFPGALYFDLSLRASSPHAPSLPRLVSWSCGSESNRA